MDFLYENIWISINISLKFVCKGQINIIPALVQIMAWHWPGNKPLSEPMMALFTDAYMPYDVKDLGNIGRGNGILFVWQHQATTSTKVDVLSIWPPRRHFNEILHFEDDGNSFPGVSKLIFNNCLEKISTFVWIIFQDVRAEEFNSLACSDMVCFGQVQQQHVDGLELTHWSYIFLALSHRYGVGDAI